MKSHARVVVIGGGVVGASALYHIVKKGWTDAALIERKELTSGSTWHAAGLLPLFNMSYSVGQIHRYSVKFYQELEKETNMDVGFRKVSNIRLATTRDRMDEFRQYAGVASTIGVEVDFLTPEQILDVWPLCNTDGLVGAIRHPEDGYIQPADLTQALARGARNLGAEIYRNTNVRKISRTVSGEWRLETDQGDITCEHVISATGNFARKTGQMVGIDIPVIPVEHQYIVTEAHPKIQARRAEGNAELGVLRDADGRWYMREEAGGLILGPYENGAPACYIDGPSRDSEYELFQEDLERLEPHIESAIHRVPAFGESGVKKIYNGAIAYTPDGNPIVGPAWDLPNFWLSEGHSFGITAAGGAGWQLAEWIVDGEPTIDMLGVDPRRYGSYAGQAYLKVKNEEAYANVFTVHFPDEERPAARPLRTAPCYDRLRALGGVFGQKFGWERANWFAPEGVPLKDHWSFRRSDYHEHVGNEVRHVAKSVGILDMSAFAKARVFGPGAENFLDYLVANRLPKQIGQVALCHALNSRGGVHSEFIIQREGEDSFYLVSAGGSHRLDHDWIKRHLPDNGSVHFNDLTNSIGVFVLAGPKSREVLKNLTCEDLTSSSFGWLFGRNINVGLAPTMAIRMNFVGELGWELHHPIEYQNHIFDELMRVGSEFDIKPFGIRAMDSMRLEKSYRVVGTELSIEYAALESGLHRFVHLNKGDFKGRDQLIRWQERGFSNKLVTLEVLDTVDADVIGGNPIFSLEGNLVGRATGGGFGFRVNKSLALAMIQPDLTAFGTQLMVDILGQRHKAIIIDDSPYDPDNKLLKS